MRNFIASLQQKAGTITGETSVLKVHAKGDSHLANSISVLSYNSIESPIADMDAIGFDYDLAIDVGDWDSNQRPPSLDPSDPAYSDSVAEGLAVKAGLNSSLVHKRAETYALSGNHDCGIGNNDWTEKYIDVLGANPSDSGVINAERPFPITYMEPGEWHSYYITVGNLMIFMISDRNDISGVPFPFGRGDIIPNGTTNGTKDGGYPSGCISKQTWEWMQAEILANTDKNIWVSSHQNPRNTTIGTPDGDSEPFHSTTTGELGAAAIYSIVDLDPIDPQNPQHDIGTDAILEFFENNPQHTVSLWMCGHTHTRVGQTYTATGDPANARGATYQIHGVTFQNICSQTQSWVRNSNGRCESRTWAITVSGTNINLKCYVHLPIQVQVSVTSVEDLPDAPSYGTNGGRTSDVAVVTDNGVESEYIFIKDTATPANSYWEYRGLFSTPPKGFVDSEEFNIRMKYPLMKI